MYSSLTWHSLPKPDPIRDLLFYMLNPIYIDLPEFGTVPEPEYEAPELFVYDDDLPF